MRKSELVIGSIVLGLGVLLLIGVWVEIDLWGLICPAGLIALGVWLIYRTQKAPGGGAVNLRFAGDIRHRGVWQPENQETWGFVLDTLLDFSDAHFTHAETTLRYVAFVNKIKLKVPAHVGVAVESMAFMTETRLNRPSEQNFFIPYEWKSTNFESAAHKVWIKAVAFVSEIKIEPMEA